MASHYSTDLVLIGGGIAGLWLLNTLQHQGYHAILLESANLGGAQTIASQGIIHGGLKYALSGNLTDAAQTIASMPERWRQSLAGEVIPDLGSVTVLNSGYYMWSAAGVRSRMKSFLGSKALRGRVEVVAPTDYPELFRVSNRTGALYRLPDFVLDTHSLLEALVSPVLNRIFKIDPDCLEIDLDRLGAVKKLRVAHGKGQVEISASRFVFCAGSGNEKLIELAGLQSVATQRRPLHMVYLLRKDLPHAFVHCIGDSFSLKPELTITSHPTESGEIVWYLGGELAESGIQRSSAAQIDVAKSFLASTFPGLDFSGADWHSFMISRAEPRVSNSNRPDNAVVLNERNVIVGWPTKLTLAPMMADQVLHLLQRSGLEPCGGESQLDLRRLLPTPNLARNFWEETPC